MLYININVTHRRVFGVIDEGGRNLNFRNRLKGNIAQSLFETLLEDVRYRIVPLGIEEAIREVVTLNHEEYLRLGLSNTLRGLPDFFVSNPDFTKTLLVETKYRGRWNDQVRDSLGRDLEEQVKQWAPLHLVLFLGEKARNNETPASYLGVCRLVYRENEVQIASTSTNLDTGKVEELFKPWRLASWNSFSRFQDVFLGVADRIEDGTLIKVVELVKSLNLIADQEL